MTGNDSHVTKKPRRLIPALLSESTVAKAAASAGVSEATAYRWLREPAFRKELAEARESVVDSALTRLRSAAAAAVDTLVEIVSDPSRSDKARLAASKQILSTVLAMRDLDLEDRVKAIEGVVHDWRSVDEES